MSVNHVVAERVVAERVAAEFAAGPGMSASLADQAVGRRLEAHRRHAEAEVQRILDAGLELMQAGGAAKPPRVGDIVRRAGVSNDAFYRAFRSKDDLVAALLEQGTRRLLAYVSYQRGKAADPEGQLRACVRAVLFHATPAGSADATRSVMTNAGARGTGATPTTPLVDGLAALLLDPLRGYGSADPDRDSRAISALCLAMLQDFLWMDRAPTEHDVDHLLTFCLRAAAPGRDDAGTESGQTRSEPPRKEPKPKAKKNKRVRL